MRRIRLYKCDRYALISDEDYEWAVQYRWTRHHKGYAQRSLGGGRKALMHREIMERVAGRKLSVKEIIDHKDGNTLRNVRDNIRIVTNSINLHNINHRWAHNKSGYRGVSKHKATGMWRGRLNVNNHEYAKYCKTRAEASKAYKEMLKQYYPAL